MKRKVILYIALSLDGYIADREGGVDWLTGLDEGHTGDCGYGDLIREIDTVLLGHKTYRQIAEELSPDKWMYEGLESYVLTHRRLEDKPGIRFINRSAGELVEELLGQAGKSIWVCGGAEIVSQLMEKDLIDEYRLTFVPRILGGGVRLFHESERTHFLRPVSAGIENGFLNCTYKRKDERV